MPIPRRLGRTAVVTSAVVALISLAACGSSVSSNSESAGASGPVKIGLAVPLSGVYASLGTDMKRGFELYLKQKSDKLGGHQIKVVSADEGETPQMGVPATTKLVTSDKVSAVVGIVNSGTALGLRDTFIQAKVPLIIANAGADGVTSPVSPYLWRTSFTNGGVGAAIGSEVAKQVKGKVYVMAADYAAGHESAGGFKSTFTKAGGTLAGETYTPFGKTSDFQPYLSKIRQSGAKAVYVFYAGAEAVAFVKQFHSFGLSKDVQLYGAGFLTEGGVLAAQGASAEGIRTALHYGDQLDNPVNTQFVKDYQAAYQALPTVYSVQAYDAAAVLDKAIGQAKTVNGAGIAAAIGEIGEIDSPRGPWSFDQINGPAQTYYLREVKSAGGTLDNAILSALK